MSPDRPKVDSVPIEWRPGDVILGLYEVRRLLGRGGMGAVYQVHHRGWDIDLAVKSPRPEILSSKRSAELFERECETWVNLGQHPNVAYCYYVRRLGGIPRVFAEYVPGGSLSAWIYSRQLYKTENPLERMLDVAIQMAWGLRYAHAQGLVHQDVKPPNILLTREGIAKVTDFGLTGAMRAASESDSPSAAPTARIRGTPMYRSPEQADRGPLTPSTDIWSWGLSVLEMFIGDVTWMAGPGAAAALEGYLELGAEDDCIPPMPPEIADLLRQCFQTDPAERPENMGTVIDSLCYIYKKTFGRPYERPIPQGEEITAQRLNNRAVSLLDLGKAAEAEQLWDRALRFDPDHLESIYNRCLYQWRRGQLTDMGMLRLVKALARSRRGDWVPTYLHAQIHFERGNYFAARHFLSKVAGGPRDGHEIASAIKEAESRLPETRRMIRSFGKHYAPISALFLTWDGKYALSGTTPTEGTGNLYLWDATTGAGIRELEGFSGGVTSACLSSDAQFAVAAFTDGSIRVWDLAHGNCIRALAGHEGPVNSVCFTDDNRGIVSGGEDGRVCLWDRDGDKPVHRLKGHAAAVTMVCVALPGWSVLSVGKDAAIFHWNLRDGKRAGVIHELGAPLLSVCVSNDRRYALVGRADGFLEYLDLSTGKRIGRRKAHSTGITAVCMSKRGRFALSGVREGKLRLWETSAHRCLHTFKGSTPISLGGEGQLALTAGPDNTLRLWYLGFESPIHRAPLLLSHAPLQSASAKATEETLETDQPEPVSTPPQG